MRRVPGFQVGLRDMDPSIDLLVHIAIQPDPETSSVEEEVGDNADDRYQENPSGVHDTGLETGSPNLSSVGQRWSV